LDPCYFQYLPISGLLAARRLLQAVLCDLPMPGNSKRTRKSKRALELEAMEAERDAYQERAHETEKQLATVSLLVSLYWRQDEPEGQVSHCAGAQPQARR
jgi:hypothetical protein